jgi:hypothetical protein
MITGDNNSADKFFNDIGEQLSLVSLSPVITFFPGVVDTGHK